MQKFNIFSDHLNTISESKALITTLNAHCYNVAQKDDAYMEALLNSNILIPDGISVVWSERWLSGKKIKKIAGQDLFYYEMERLQQKGGKCFFLGSSEETLIKIKNRALIEFPSVTVETYSPPYKNEFSLNENLQMLEMINNLQPDVLMVGMTAPKQEKWAYQNYNLLKAGHICCIGAVFDYFAGNINRAPNWMIDLGLEWFYRLIKEPRRMWIRYLVGNFLFVWSIINQKING
jgi:N-acetylglucosaminyldiphosphoundecaprenol N-acetyl-beta-D-mannosaminyltransferase